MTIGKITVDNSLRYIPKSEQTREIKQITIQKKSSPRQQNRNISQNSKKFLESISASGFKYIK